MPSSNSWAYLQPVLTELFIKCLRNTGWYLCYLDYLTVCTGNFCWLLIQLTLPCSLFLIKTKNNLHSLTTLCSIYVPVRMSYMPFSDPFSSLKTKMPIVFPSLLQTHNFPPSTVVRQACLLSLTKYGHSLGRMDPPCTSSPFCLEHYSPSHG